MKIGFVGAGAMARAVAKRLVAAGHEAMLSNSRDPGTIAEVGSCKEQISSSFSGTFTPQLFCSDVHPLVAALLLLGISVEVRTPKTRLKMAST